MTAQQPTAPWTPERALAMFKDWDDPDLTMREFCEKWYVAYSPDDFALIAIEALESATAEIERQMARADRAKAEVQRMNSDTESQVKMIVPYVSGDMLCQPWHVIVKTLAEGEKKQYARADAAEAKLANVEKREADGVALFDDLLARERSTVSSLKAELAKAQQQPEPVAVPSDEEIGEDLSRCYQDDRCSRPVYRALLGIAQRIGVKL